MVPPAADATRARLLDIAGPLFAQHGFRDTGIKQICDAAGCNVAAINYHFGSKQDFYAAVLAHAHRSAFSVHPMPQPRRGMAAEEEFREWVRWWIRSMLNPDKPVWLQTLMAREMVDPTSALDEMVERSVRPLFDRLFGIVRRLLPRGAGVEHARLCVHGVIGQALHYKHARPVMQRLGTMPVLDDDGLSRLATHIVEFSLGGIAAIAKTIAAKPTTKPTAKPARRRSK